MEVVSQIEKDYGQAFKEKNELVILTLRGLKAAITNAEIGKNRQALTEAELIKLLRTEVKRRREAMALYQQGGRPELADKEEKEIAIISRYLPAEVDAETIRSKVAAVIAQSGAAGPQAAGKVMGLVMKELGGAADGNVVGQIVKEELAK